MRRLQHLAYWATALAAAAIVIAFLPGCATPQSFNETLLTSYNTVAETRKSAATLVNAGKLSSADGENVQKQADTARAGLDLARSMRATNPQGADDKLQSSRTIIQALKAYLLAKETRK